MASADFDPGVRTRSSIGGLTSTTCAKQPKVAGIPRSQSQINKSLCHVQWDCLPEPLLAGAMGETVVGATRRWECIKHIVTLQSVCNIAGAPGGPDYSRRACASLK
jgi:hypothetical protein